MTRAVAINASATTRSVPRITPTFAFPAVAAIVDQARPRNLGSGGGTAFPGALYPGTKHSGKQMRSAPSLFCVPLQALHSTFREIGQHRRDNKACGSSTDSRRGG